MRYATFFLLLLTIAGFLSMEACNRESSGTDAEAGARAAAAVAAIALHSEALPAEHAENPVPSAPIDLDYQLPSSAPAGQPLTIDLAFNTPLGKGVLQVSAAKLVGVTLLSDAVQSIDLAGTARPIMVPLIVVPSAQAQRSLVIVVAIDVSGERQLRNFRIALPGS